MPIFLSCFIIFVIWIRYETTKSTRTSQKSSTDFWNEEQKSNFVRKADISNLDYIIIPLENLPFVETDEEELIRVQNQVKLYAEKKMLNLSHLNNTQLKMMYGTANLTLLTEYDQNYMLFIQSLYHWSSLLYKNGFVEEAKKALELGITHGTDISGHYILLANIYKEQNNLAGIRTLLSKAEGLDTLMKDSILQSLTHIMNSY